MTRKPAAPAKRPSRTGKGTRPPAKPAPNQVFEEPDAPSDFLTLPQERGADLLTRSRAAWEMGDWLKLARLAGQPLETLENREKLALLAAVGLAQTGQMEDARQHARLARAWGCPAILMARVLVGGALNSLGRVASLLGDAPLARDYFESSLWTVNPRADAALLGRARDINEKAALGLLPEAAAMMGQELADMRTGQTVPRPEAEMFRVQLELMNGVLAQAQKRHQLTAAGTAPAQTLKQRAVSQLGQELWVLEQTGHKRGGFFVEFGATDGVLLSNTLLLESEFGWSGICAEPNPKFLRKLRANRGCIVAPDCIAGRSGDMVDFILADEYGGIADFANDDPHVARRAAFRELGEVIRLPTISLDDFLKKYDAPREIDYLSIDTEGSEYEILRAFPFGEWDIRLLTVEHNFTALRADIRRLLEGHGYACTQMQWDDWYFRPATG